MMPIINPIDHTEEVLVLQVDDSSRILHIVYHDKRFTGFAERIMGKTFKSIGLATTDREECTERLQKVFLKGKKEVFQLQMKNRYYQISYLPEEKVKGQVETVMAIIRDISKEQKLKATLLVSRVQLEKALQFAMLGYFERDVVYEKLYWSDQLYKNINVAPQEQLPSIEFLLSRIHPEDVEMVRAEIVQMPPEEFFDSEYRIIKKDGSVGWLHSLVQSVFDHNGQLLRKFGTFQDITKRKELELELQGLTEQLQIANDLLAAKERSTRLAGEIAKVGYFEWDPTKCHLYWSDQQYRNLGYTLGEVTPTLEIFHERIHPEDWDLVQAARAELYKKSYQECQFRVIKADGSMGWLHSRASVIRNEQGNPTKILGVTQEITQQKRAEEQMHRVEQELAFTNLLYSRSTYLNNLLFNDYPVAHITTALNEFGIETEMPRCCFVVQLVEKLADNTKRLKDRMTPLRERKQAVLIWLAESQWGVVWRCHDNIVLLTSISDQIAANKQSQIRFAKDIIVNIEKLFPHFYVKVGISGISSIPLNFRDLYEKAHRAVVIAASMELSSAIHVDDIGLYEVAFQLLQDTNICTMVQNTVGRLAEHDEARGSNLLITLQCILEYKSLKAVAEELFVHHNTVIWRKRKIEELLEISLDTMETKMLLLLYIKIWNLKQTIV